MCSTCYRKYGRDQFAYACAHTERPIYSLGMCHACYIDDYLKRKYQNPSLIQRGSRKQPTLDIDPEVEKKLKKR